MFQLVYSSSSRAQALSKKDLEDILTVSRRNNQRDDITGILLYRSGSIMQVLEGEEAAVRNLHAKIQQDSRHTNLTLIYAVPLVEREFPDWWMGFDWAAAGFASAPEQAGAVPYGYQPVSAGRAGALVKTFADSTR